MRRDYKVFSALGPPSLQARRTSDPMRSLRHPHGLTFLQPMILGVRSWRALRSTSMTRSEAPFVDKWPGIPYRAVVIRQFHYEGNLSPGADRQAMLEEIKRFLPAGKLRLIHHLVDREREILVETHIPSE